MTKNCGKKFNIVLRKERISYPNPNPVNNWAINCVLPKSQKKKHLSCK